MNEQRPIIVQSGGPGCGTIALGIVGAILLCVLIPALLVFGGAVAGNVTDAFGTVTPAP